MQLRTFPMGPQVRTLQGQLMIWRMRPTLPLCTKGEALSGCAVVWQLLLCEEVGGAHAFVGDDMEDEADSAFVLQGLWPAEEVAIHGESTSSPHLRPSISAQHRAVDQFAEKSAPRKGIREVGEHRTC